MILRYSLTSSDRLIADDKGIQYLASQWDRTGIYMELQPLLNAGRASLSDQPELLRELRGPEPAPWSSWKRIPSNMVAAPDVNCERGFRHHSQCSHLSGHGS